MESLGHPGFVEIVYPEFFSRDPRLDNLARIVTARQPGTHNLLLDLSGFDGEPAKRDESDVRHFARTMNDAFEAMSDALELLALLVRPEHLQAARPYVRELEACGYDVRLFSERAHAAGWLSPK